MEDIYENNFKNLEEVLSKYKLTLTPKQKDFLLYFLDFGYAAAFCETRADNNPIERQVYHEGFEKIKKLLKK